jgi:hypothetical protein
MRGFARPPVQFDGDVVEGELVESAFQVPARTPNGAPGVLHDVEHVLRGPERVLHF